MFAPAEPISRAERMASVALATGITVGVMVFVLRAPGLHFERVPREALDFATVEHITYVVAAAAPAAISAVRPGRARVTRVAAVDTAARPLPPRDVAPVVRTEAFDSATRSSVASGTSSLGTAAGAPARAAVAGFSSATDEVWHVDSALRAFRDKLGAGLSAGTIAIPPPSQAERDDKLRGEALAATAARGAGLPLIPRIKAGASIPVGLPFGGPSRKQRERDRVINAQTMAVLARIYKRADSVAAARRRDSLAALTDSVRRPSPARR
jgi:hypothetical protein